MNQIQRPAVRKSLSDLIRFAGRQAEDKGFLPNRVQEIELAVEEALVNILTYAYPNTRGDVRIRSRNEKEKLVIEIVDHGVAFDPLSLQVPDLLAELAVRRVGGLGVFLVRKMSDHVHYRRDGGANVLTLLFGSVSPFSDT